MADGDVDGREVQERSEQLRDSAQRFDIATRGMVGKRMTFAELTGKNQEAVY